MAAEHQNTAVADLQGDNVSEDDAKVGVQDPEEPEVEKEVVAKALPVIHFGRMKESWEVAEPVAEVAEEGPEDEPPEGFEAQGPAFLKPEESPDSDQEDKQLLRSGSRDASHGDSSPFEEASDAELEPRQEGETQPLPQIDRETQHPVSSLLIKDEPEFMEVVEEDAVEEGGATLDIERQCFRQFCYQDAEGPREVCGMLWKLCRRWLQPEKKSKEQILELVILEQFLAILPREMQSWVRDGRPETCFQAIGLAEAFLAKQQGSKPRGRQALWPFSEATADSAKKASSDSATWPLFRENKEDEESSSVTLLGDGRPFWKEKNLPVNSSGIEVPWVVPGNAKETLSKNPGKGEASECQQKAHLSSKEVETIRFHPASIENPYTCWDCGESFTGIEVLVAHQSTHTGVKPFNCSECGKSFIQRSLLTAHEKTHTQEKPFSCPECGQSFSKKAGLVSHQKIHTGEKPHQCQECGQSFLHRYDLVRHLRIHTGEKPHKCPDCGRGFRNMSAFHVHRRIHTEERPYPCSACGKTFRHRTNLIVHERIHTGEKPYKCEDCTKSFSDTSSLRKHRRSHTGERPYVCPECGKTFSQNAGLVQHKKIHTGEKPFQCAFCPKTFRGKSAIVAHLRTHTKETPYECRICKKCFGHRSNLIKHERIHTAPKKFKRSQCV
ncbi:zinc finger and SCAN domain-containing protein 31-like isoform X2 [Sceloporus undulatus]|uniref:zinc finger and SCAN domain-containing protein 31-like isoform X2 n=1 Tax=Sceloporus undulatus TaxID=8520 RepID=UPI001C4D36DA|nr:zinc finger and SCAN domain-containing protein 31-like isoform X2 [Sceloporus undulatus]